MARLASSTIKIKISSTTISSDTAINLYYGPSESNRTQITGLGNLTVADLVTGYCIPGNTVPLGQDTLWVYFSGECSHNESITIDPGVIPVTNTPTPTPTATLRPKPTESTPTPTPTATPTNTPSPVTYYYYVVKGCPGSFYDGKDRAVRVTEEVFFDGGPSYREGGLYQYGTHIVYINGSSWYFYQGTTESAWNNGTSQFDYSSETISASSITQNTC